MEAKFISTSYTLAFSMRSKKNVVQCISVEVAAPSEPADRNCGSNPTWASPRESGMGSREWHEGCASVTLTAKTPRVGIGAA